MEREEEQREEEEEAVKKEVKYNEQLKVLEEQEEQRNLSLVPLLRLLCLKKFFWNPEPPPEPERELEPEPPLEPKTFKIIIIKKSKLNLLRVCDEQKFGRARPVLRSLLPPSGQQPPLQLLGATQHYVTPYTDGSKTTPPLL